jgi:hypothetical protein
MKIAFEINVIATNRKVSDEAIGFFSQPNPTNRAMALGLTQPLTEMSTSNLPGGKARPARKADKLNAISEPIV